MDLFLSLFLFLAVSVADGYPPESPFIRGFTEREECEAAMLRVREVAPDVKAACFGPVPVTVRLK